MNAEQKDTYFLAVKVFLEKDGKFLVLKDRFGDWDLPGGRLKKDEFDTPFEQVVARKMREELGGDIKYILGKPIVFMRHQRIEKIEGEPREESASALLQGEPVVRIFALGYQATLQSGAINLSPRHTEMLWVDPNNFAPENYFKGGWLKGAQDYLKVRQNYTNWDVFTNEIKKFAKSIDYQPDCIIGIARGGVIPAVLLAEYLKVKDMYTLKVRIEGNERKIIAEVFTDISNKNVLLVEDMLETGQSMAVVKNYLQQKGAKVKTACLYVMAKTEFVPDYYLREVSEKPRFPWEI